MKDVYEDWLRIQREVKLESADPAFEVRPVLPSDFESIYDLLDLAFGKKRDRRGYDWIYRNNPCGLARCLMVVEKSSGHPVWASALWPWPAAHGDEPLLGLLMGDAATAPQLRNQRLVLLSRPFFEAHPYYGEEVAFGWPNTKSRSWVTKIERSRSVAGPIPRATLYLRARARLARRGWPRLLANLAGAALDGWHARAGGAADPSDLRVEEPSCFEAAMDPLAKHGLRSDGYWFPRDAAFLNWRYHAHPTHRYRSLVLLSGEIPVGYAVLKLDPGRATLMELVTQPGPAQPARALLDAVEGAAREEDCARIDVFATAGWRHWPLLRERGFLERDSQHYVFLRRGHQLVADLEEWQILAGDHDAF